MAEVYLVGQALAEITIAVSLPLGDAMIERIGANSRSFWHAICYAFV